MSVLSQILGTANSERAGEYDPCSAVKKILATTNHIQLEDGRASPSNPR